MGLVALSERNKRMGEDHGLAKLSNHDVELIKNLLAYRDELIEKYQRQGVSERRIHYLINGMQLGYAGIAEKFDCSKRHIRDIANGAVRRCIAATYRRVPDKPAKPEAIEDQPFDVMGGMGPNGF